MYIIMALSRLFNDLFEYARTSASWAYSVHLFVWDVQLFVLHSGHLGRFRGKLASGVSGSRSTKMAHSIQS